MKLFSGIERIANKEWKARIAEIWVEMLQESCWSSPPECPYNPLVPSVNLVDHVNQVVEGAFNLAIRSREYINLPINMDILLAAGYLHDVSKLVEYELGPDGRPRKSQLGRAYQHAVYGAFKAEAKGFPVSVVQIIINHTVLSREIPNTPEALCIYYADMCAADLARVSAGQKLLIEGHK